jgi:hypothetical protein
MAALFFGCAYLSAGVVYVVVVEFPISVWVRARAFSASMLSPMGTLFALFVVFTAAQVWNDTDRATAAVAQEASALRAVLVLATAFPQELRGRLETLVHDHVEEAATNEWPMMAHQTATLEIVPYNLVEALQLTLSLTPASQGQRIAQREMTIALESALDARRQRILISHSSVSLLKWGCLVIRLRFDRHSSVPRRYAGRWARRHGPLRHRCGRLLLAHRGLRPAFHRTTLDPARSLVAGHAGGIGPICGAVVRTMLRIVT